MNDGRIKGILLRGLLLALMVMVLLLLVRRETPCIFRQYTGVLCPTCGMSRAWLAVFRLEIGDAFRYHPMFLGIPILGVTFLLDGFSFPGKRGSKMLYLLILSGFALTYLIRLVCFLYGASTV